MKKIVSLILVSALLLSLSINVFAAKEGSSIDNPVVFTSDSFNMATLAKGETLWFCYDNASLVDNGEFARILSSNCQYAYTINFNSVDYTSDENGFLNMRIEDDDHDGKYYFSITNNATRKINVFINFEAVPTYVLTGVNIVVGDNNITYDSSAPAALYSFSTGNVDVTDVDGNIVSTIEGPGAGEYVFTVKDSNGNKIDGVLLGNWGTVGFPNDITGDAKSNPFTWGSEEADASFLLGVSNVTQDFVITVERKGDYDDGVERVVFEEYVNVHTPSKFTMPEGELVKIDISTQHTLVLGNDQFYHLDSADGPVVYVDLKRDDTIDIFAAYNSAYGAITLKGTYINNDGVKCGYEFINSMRPYAEAIDSDGYYPMTVDIENFVKYYGAAQGWYREDLSSITEIVNGEYVPESAWLATAYYLKTSENAGNNNSGTIEGGNGSGGESSDKIPGVGAPEVGTESDGTVKNPSTGNVSENNTTTESAPVTSPQTGDNMSVVIVIALVALAACVAIFVVRRKTSK